jgi:hypothetical protein
MEAGGRLAFWQLARQNLGVDHVDRCAGGRGRDLVEDVGELQLPLLGGGRRMAVRSRISQRLSVREAPRLLVLVVGKVVEEQ